MKLKENSCPNCESLRQERDRLALKLEIIGKLGCTECSDKLQAGAAREKALVEALEKAKALVDVQAKDESLWFEAVYVSEAILQQALRKLHEVIEGKSQEDCAKAALAERVK